jgi:hypothetical protein
MRPLIAPEKLRLRRKAACRPTESGPCRPDDVPTSPGRRRFPNRRLPLVRGTTGEIPRSPSGNAGQLATLACSSQSVRKDTPRRGKQAGKKKRGHAALFNVLSETGSVLQGEASMAIYVCAPMKTIETS